MRVLFTALSLGAIIEDTGERYPQPTYPRVAVPIGEISSAVGEE